MLPWLVKRFSSVAPAALVVLFLALIGRGVEAQVGSISRGAVTYEMVRDPKGPWVIHVVRVARNEPRLQIQSLHANGAALGLATLTSQIKLLEPTLPLAAINGDFYVRAGSYAGDPRGLQIVEGEMISAPGGGASFWLDVAGQPQLGETKGQLEVSWGATNRTISLNSFRETNAVVLYTPAVGTSTRTLGGREVIVTARAPGPSLPLRPGRIYHGAVQETRESGDSPVAAGTMVLSIGPAVAPVPELKAGDELIITTFTEPALRGVRNAISGGPVLLRDGKRTRIQRRGAVAEDSYEFSTMSERHPRSGIGWNQDFFLLVTVDGRQTGISVGMTLDEFAARFVQLGCTEAFNLDGGGSSTLWYDGKVRNYLCDGYEREIANSLVVAEKRIAR